MSEFKKLGHVSPTDGLGSGGTSVKPGKVSDLLNPSTSQIPLYDATKTYKESDYVMVKEKNAYVIYKSLYNDVTGPFNPTDWEKYTLGNTLADIRTEMAESTNALMAEIVKGGGSSKSSTSGILDWMPTNDEQIASNFNPFLGFVENGFGKYNGIVVDGTVIEHDVTSTFKLQDVSPVGVSYELVFLEAYRVFENDMVRMKHRLRSFMLSELDYKQAKKEGSYFLGLSKSRVRFVQAQGANTVPLAEAVDPSTTSRGYLYSTFLSSAEREASSVSGKQYALQDTGLWVAGDGSIASKEALGTYDGYSFAIPLTILRRRNSGTGSVNNVNGGNDYVMLSFASSITFDPKGSGYATAIPVLNTASYLKAGMKFVKQNATSTDEVLEFADVKDFVRRDLFRSLSNRAVAVDAGSIWISTTTNPYNKYTNVIEPADVVEIQQTLSSQMTDFMATLDSNFNKFMRGELLENQEELIAESFEPENNGQALSKSVSNLIPEVTADGLSLVNLLSGVHNVDGVFTQNNDTISTSIKRLPDASYDITATVVKENTGSLKSIVNILPTINFLDFTMDQNYLIAMDVKSSTGIRLINNNDEASLLSSGMQINGTLYAIKGKDTVLNNLAIMATNAPQVGTTITINVSNLRMYGIGSTTNFPTSADLAKYPHVVNVSKQAQNLFTFKEPFDDSYNDGAVLEYVTDNMYRYTPGQETDAMGRISGEGCVLSLDISGVGNIGTIDFVTNTDKIITSVSLKKPQTVNVLIPNIKYLYIRGGGTAIVSNVQVRPLFSTQTSYVPSGVWSNNMGDQTFIHRLKAFDRYRKVWSNKPSSTKVNRIVYPTKNDNLSDINLTTQKVTGKFSTDDKVSIDAQNVIGPVVDGPVLANASRIVNISGNVITLDNTTNLTVGDKVNIFNPDTMTTIVSNVTVQTIDTTTRAVTLNTSQTLRPGYLVLETMATPFVPTTDSMLQASWDRINTKNPEMTIKNLTPPTVVNPFSDVYDDRMTKIMTAEDLNVKAPDPLTPVKWRSISTSHSAFAIDENDKLWAWGNNINGRLGFPGVNQLAYATRIKGMENCKEVYAGFNVTFVLKNDGTLWMCGSKDAGSGMTPSARNAWEFTRVSFPEGVKITYFEPRVFTQKPVSIAIADNGDVYTCGGDTLIVPGSSPTFVKYTTGWKTATASNGTTLFVKSDGTLWGMGVNGSGILLTGNTTAVDTPIRLLPAVSNVKSVKISANGKVVGVLTEDGKIYYWGNVYQNDTSYTNVGYTTPALLTASAEWASFDVSDNTIAAVKKDGTAWSLGLAPVSGYYAPLTQINSNVKTMIMSYGGTGYIALKNDGSIETFGRNSNYVLAAGRKGLNGGTALYQQKFEKIQYNASEQIHRIFPTMLISYLSVAPNHTAFIDLDGYLYTIGSNAKGQLGDGTTIDKTYPIKAEILGKCKDFSIGRTNIAAVAEDGTLWHAGELTGTSSINGVSTIVNGWTQIDTNTTWEKVETDGNTILALRNNMLYTIGSTTYNGINSATTTFKPLTSLSDEAQTSKIKKFAFSERNGFVLFDNGRLYTWGFNTAGELFIGSNSTITLPSRVVYGALSSGFVEDIHVNTSTAYVKLSSGNWYAAGVGTGYQIPGATSNQPAPIIITSPSEIYKIFPAQYGFFALCYSGEIYHISSSKPQLDNVISGSSTLAEYVPPTHMSGIIGLCTTSLSSFVETLNGVSFINYNVTTVDSTKRLQPMDTNPNQLYSKADYFSDYAHKTHHNKLFASNNNVFVNYQDGTVWGAGQNTSNMIPNSSASTTATGPAYRLRQTNHNVTGRVKKVISSSANTYVLYDDGRLYSAGDNSKGQLISFGVADSTVRNQFNYVKDYRVRDVAAFGSTVAILLDNGDVYVAGDNTYSQAGTTASASEPVAKLITGGPSGGYKAITMGFGTVYALGSNNRIYGWGNNPNGQLGTGVVSPSKSVIMLSTEEDFVEIDAGYGHLIARKADGTLWALGRNNVGQGGQNAVSDVTTLTKIGTDSDWKQFACGAYHTIAVKHDGTLWSWGINDKEQQANTVTGTAIRVPTRLGKEADWDYVAAGYRSSYAVKKNGAVYTWGDNGVGQLGLGSVIPSTSRMTLLTQRLYPSKYTQVTTGETTLALDRTGKLMGRGANDVYKISNTDTTNRTAMTPVTYVTGKVLTKASQSAFLHVIALDEMGSLFGWASNNNGQLGTTASTTSPYPLYAMTPTNVVDIFAVADHTFLLKADGTLHAAGLNSKGQLGTGTTTSPVASFTSITTPEPLIGIAENSWITSNTIYGWSKSGNVYATGSKYTPAFATNSSTTSTDIVTSFTQLTAPELKNVIKVTTSLNGPNALVVVLKDDGTIWGFGKNVNKTLDLNSSTSTVFETPVRILPMGLENVKVVDVCLTLSAIVVVLEDGRVYFTGSLGSDFVHVGYWVRIELPYRASAVSCSLDTVSIEHEYGHSLIGRNTTLQIASNVVYPQYPTSLDDTITFKPRLLTYADTSSKTGIALDFYGSAYGWGDCTMFGGSVNQELYKVNRTLNFITLVVSENGAMGVTHDGFLYTIGGQTSVKGLALNGGQPVTSFKKVGTDNFWGRDLSIFKDWGFAISKTGVLYAWGDNTNGELGFTKTTSLYHFPTAVTGMTDVAKVYARGHFAIKTDGSLWGTTDVPTGMTAKEAFQNIYPGTKWKAIAKNSSFASGQTFLGVQDDGTLWVYGLNGVTSLTKVGTAVNWVSVAVSRDGKSCRALNANGHVYVFGLSDKGSLSLGALDAEQITTPRLLPLTNVQMITGDTNPVYVTTNAELLISGKNDNGLVTPALQSDYIQYTLKGISNSGLLSGIRKILKTYSEGSLIILKEDGTLWGMGSNEGGILGLGHTSSVSKLTRLNAFNDWKDVCVSESTVYALRENGDLYAWGANDTGQFGIGTTDPKGTVSRLVPNFLSSGWSNIYCNITYNSIGRAIVIGVTISGSVYAWAGETNVVSMTLLKRAPQLNEPYRTDMFRTFAYPDVKVATAGPLAIIADAISVYYVGSVETSDTVENILPHRGSVTRCTLSNDAMVQYVDQNGQLYSFGTNTYYFMGGGSLNANINSFTVTPNPKNYKKVVSNNRVAYGLTDDTGEIYYWGSFTSDTPPVGATSETISTPRRLIADNPVTVANVKDIQLSSEGGLYILAKNGYFYGMGYVSTVLVDGSTSDAAVRTDPDYLVGEVVPATVVKYSIDYRTLLMLGDDGCIYGAGSNSSKQLSPNLSSSVSTTWYKVNSDTDWVDVNTSGNTTVALKSNGTIHTWGSKYLIDGTTTPTTAITQLGTRTDWVSIHFRNNLLFAKDTQGNVFALGDNTSGRSGNGTTGGRLADFTEIPALKNMRSINTSANVTIAEVDDYMVFSGVVGSVISTNTFNKNTTLVNGKLANKEVIPLVNRQDLGFNSIGGIGVSRKGIIISDNDGNAVINGFLASNVLGTTGTGFRPSPIKIPSNMTNPIISEGAFYSQNDPVIVGRDGNAYTTDTTIVGSVDTREKIPNTNLYKVKFNTKPTEPVAAITSIASSGLADYRLMLDTQSNIWSSKNTPLTIDPKYRQTTYRKSYENVKNFYTSGQSIIMEDINGKFWAKGKNNAGQLGIGNLVTQDEFVPFAGSWKKIVFGSYDNRVVGIKTDGTVYEWGNGVTTPTLNSVLSANAATKPMVDVSVGKRHDLYMNNAGSVVAYAPFTDSNANGQMGITASTPAATTAKTIYQITGAITAASVCTSIYAGDTVSFVISSAGKLYAAGIMTYGLSTLSTMKSAFVEIPLPGTGKAKKVSINASLQVAVLMDDGSVYVAGITQYGEFGTIASNSALDLKQWTLLDVPTKTAIVDVELSYKSIFMVDIGGNVYTRGRGDSGQLGFYPYNAKNAEWYTFPSQGVTKLIPPMVDGEMTYYAIDQNNRILAWGSNSYNALGVSTKDNPVDRPFSVSYQELYARNAGLNRTVKSVDNVIVNDRTYKKDYTFTVKVPINIASSYMDTISNPLTATTINGISATTVVMAGTLFAHYIDDTRFTKLFNVSQDEALSYVTKITLTASVKAKATGTQITNMSGGSVVSVPTTYRNIAFDLVRSTSSKPTTPVSVLKVTGATAANPITMVDPAIEFVFTVPNKPNTSIYVPQKIEWEVEKASRASRVVNPFLMKKRSSLENPHMIHTVNATTLKRDELSTEGYNVIAEGKTTQVKFPSTATASDYLEVTLDLKNQMGTTRTVVLNGIASVIITGSFKKAGVELPVKLLATDGSTQTITRSVDGTYTLPVNNTTLLGDGSLVLRIGTLAANETLDMKLPSMSFTYTADYKASHFNAIYVDATNGAVETLFPITNELGEFDKISLFYRSTPKVQPVTQTSDMVVLAESDHILVTDIGDITLVDQGEAPFPNPLSQFDYNYKDLLGVMGFDGLTFTGDSARVNVDSRIAIKNGILTGATQQRIVKDFGTNAIGITRMLVWYEGILHMLLTLTRTEDGVFDTQSTRAKRYLVPIEGNIRMNEPPSKTRKTILSKKIWR